MSEIVKLSHHLFNRYIDQKSVVIDATCGNGYDTKYLADKVGKIYSFDIQNKAIEETKKRCKNFNNIEYILDGHENIDQYIKSDIDLVVFNTGYLPGSDKTVNTQFKTTKKAILSSLNLLKKRKGIILTLYYGHKEGNLEGEQLIPFLKNFDKNSVDIFKHQLINKPNNPPIIYEIIKR